QYEVKDGAIVCRPKKGGTIYTKGEYGDFVARLEYKLPPGGNNGLAIRYPGRGDTAYVGMCEVQVLDDTAPQYAKLDPRQYNGSVYGIVAAQRGYLRPVGVWNFEEVTIKGPTIKVELNGTVIVDTDVSKVTQYMANRPHPGKERTSGTFGFAGADIGSLTGSKNLKLVAVAEVDLSRVGKIKKRFPEVKVYQDWRDLLDKEKNLNSANISTPDHMHAPITMRAMQQGLHVYTQKPLTQTIYEARQLTRVARERKLISQMGIQIHSHDVHRTVVALIQAGAIGKVREVHSWSDKQ